MSHTNKQPGVINMPVMSFDQICREAHHLCALADEPTAHCREAEYKRVFNFVWSCHKVGAITAAQYMKLHRDTADSYYMQDDEDRKDAFLEGK
jgi:ribosomal protein L37AE/L43A